MSLHVLPRNDLIEHEMSSLCPCGPHMKWGDESGNYDEPLIVHNSLDGRELSE